MITSKSSRRWRHRDGFWGIAIKTCRRPLLDQVLKSIYVLKISWDPNVDTWRVFSTTTTYYEDPPVFGGKQSRQMMRPYIERSKWLKLFGTGGIGFFWSPSWKLLFSTKQIMPFQTFKQKIVHVNCSHFQWTSYFVNFSTSYFGCPMGPKNGTPKWDPVFGVKHSQVEVEDSTFLQLADGQWIPIFQAAGGRFSRVGCVKVEASWIQCDKFRSR